MFYLSFLYVACVASGCFKSILGVVHGMRVRSRRVCERSPRGRRSDGAGPRVGAGDAGAVKRRPGGAGPHVDARETKGEIDCSHGRPDDRPGLVQID